MRLGLIADIHEQVEFLRAALDRFRQEHVDRVVVLGDVFEMGERIEEICRLLAEAQAVGVWGNHDFGLCSDPSDDVRSRYPALVTDYMTTLRPRLEVDGCYFAHIDPGSIRTTSRISGSSRGRQTVTDDWIAFSTPCPTGSCSPDITTAGCSPRLVVSPSGRASVRFG